VSVLRAHRSAWLLGFAVMACRYGYEDLGADVSDAAASGAATAPTAGAVQGQGAAATFGGDGTTGLAGESA
jgi:hypothetical protein